MVDTSFLPVRLATLPHAFDDGAFLYELKYDGFRALAHAEGGGGVRLLSRNSHQYRIFPHLNRAISAVLGARDAVLDGEIVSFGQDGRTQFYDLVRRRGPEHFCAFDLLRLDGQDLRGRPLIERKRLLRALIPPHPCALFYVDFIRERGSALFDLCCRLDLEGIVAKRSDSPYAMTGPFRRGAERTSWAKIRNAGYSQWKGRSELFRKRSG
jgi:bifunctional non-homologous end joining protein LigD